MAQLVWAKPQESKDPRVMGSNPTGAIGWTICRQYILGMTT